MSKNYQELSGTPNPGLFPKVYPLTQNVITYKNNFSVVNALYFRKNFFRISCVIFPLRMSFFLEVSRTQHLSQNFRKKILRKLFS